MPTVNLGGELAAPILNAIARAGRAHVVVAAAEPRLCRSSGMGEAVTPYPCSGNPWSPTLFSDRTCPPPPTPRTAHQPTAMSDSYKCLHI